MGEIEVVALDDHLPEPQPTAEPSLEDLPSMNRVSDEIARTVFDDAHRAYVEPSHPCHQFRNLQHGVPDDRWQLPEPFDGRTANAGLVFLGHNPNYDPREDVPTITTDYEQWRSFCEARFDAPEDQWDMLYRKYQRIGVTAVGSDFHLGADGLVLEIIRFRSHGGEGCGDPAVLDHEWPLTLAMLRDIQPRAIVVNGRPALDALCARAPELSAWTAGRRLDALEGTWVRASVEGLEAPVAVIPTRHLCAAVGVSTATVNLVAEATRQALA